MDDKIAAHRQKQGNYEWQELQRHLHAHLHITQYLLRTDKAKRPTFIVQLKILIILLLYLSSVYQVHARVPNPEEALK